MDIFERIQELESKGVVWCAYFGKLYELIGIDDEYLTRPQQRLKEDLRKALSIYDQGKADSIFITSRRNVLVRSDNKWVPVR